MGIRQRTISTHPLLITLAYLVVFAAPALGRTSGFSLNDFAMIAALLVTVLWWNWSLYSLAREAAPGFSTRLGAVFGQGAFVVTLGAWGALLIADQNTFMPAVVLGHFTTAWLAANALVRFELRQDRFPWWRAFWTFLLVFYLPIGAWFLHPRIKRLLARQPLGNAPN